MDEYYVDEIDWRRIVILPDGFVDMLEMLEHMAMCLAEGGRIEIRGFGSFSLHFRRARPARNPKTGTPVILVAKHVPYFKPGSALRERVDRLPPGAWRGFGRRVEVHRGAPARRPPVARSEYTT